MNTLNADLVDTSEHRKDIIVRDKTVECDEYDTGSGSTEGIK